MSATNECSEDFFMKNKYFRYVVLCNEPIYTHFVHQCGLQLTKSSQRVNFSMKTLKKSYNFFYTFLESYSHYFPFSLPLCRR